jgi:sugar/nucleoside kinase (ribokinase family)
MGPILHEIPRTLALSLADRDAIVSLDPQGYLRRILHDGRIRTSKWLDRRVLKRLDLLKLSEQEASLVIGSNFASPRKLTAVGPEVILITKAASGTVVWSKRLGMFNVPAFKTKVRDPTGAGDAFVGALLVTWVKEGDLLWSAAVGSAVASFVVEKVGPANFGTPREIKQRASVIADETVRK